jgi:hypothetical protein
MIEPLDATVCKANNSGKVGVQGVFFYCPDLTLIWWVSNAALPRIYQHSPKKVGTNHDDCSNYGLAKHYFYNGT